MIIEVRIDNYRVFNNPVALSAKADLRNKRFAFNVFNNEKFNILKSLAVYGPNNVGKTCVVQCIQDIKHVMDNTRPLAIVPNIFTKQPDCRLGITFMVERRVFSYDFTYDIHAREFIYERFAEFVNNSKKDTVYFEKDSVHNTYFFKENKEIEKLLSVIGRNNILIYLIDTAKFKDLAWIRDVMVSFAEKIDIVNMNSIPLKKTIDILKTPGAMQKKIVAFIKNADLDLDDYSYNNKDAIKNFTVEFDTNGDGTFTPEAALKAQNNLLEQCCLVSRHRGIDMPSILIDSTGTKKIVALASYVLEAIEKGRILVVDELDSSLHFKLTRAIVALFNNEINTAGQLIFTIHDISLLDCKRLFRKEQVWFIHKDRNRTWLYSLAEFKSRNHGTRDTTDIIEHYKKGVYGAVPEPSLIKVLLEVGK